MKIGKLLLSLVLLSVIVGVSVKLGVFDKATAYAVGDLTVDWGIGVGNVGPIFSIADVFPGAPASTKSVIITNGSTTTKPVGLRGVVSQDNGLASGLVIVISQGGSDIYGGTTGTKTLLQFFQDSENNHFVTLGNLSPSATATYTISVSLPESAGNEFQNKSVQFDLRIGYAVDIPLACTGITFTGDPIYGTDGNDILNAHPGNNLVISFEGNDRIHGGSGNDCIITGNGNNTIDGGAGNDVVVAGNGRNDINGNSGKDTITAGSGNNKIDGGSDNDMIVIIGNGINTIRGGSGKDTITGGNGPDMIDGGSDDDTIFGSGGNDQILGLAGKDMLFGDDGIDSIDGGSDKDTCVGEVKTKCEL